MPSRLAGPVFVLIASCVAPVAPDASSATPPESLLQAGPFTVGFRSTWALDEGRTYRTAFDDGQTYGAEKAPRPVLVLLWYPADSAAAGAEPLSHGRSRPCTSCAWRTTSTPRTRTSRPSCARSRSSPGSASAGRCKTSPPPSPEV